jgi:hypothetical protein
MAGARARSPEVDKALDALGGLEPPRSYEDWESKLRGAKRAVDHMYYVCPAIK